MKYWSGRVVAMTAIATLTLVGMTAQGTPPTPSRSPVIARPSSSPAGTIAPLSTTSSPQAAAAQTALPGGSPATQAVDSPVPLPSPTPVPSPEPLPEFASLPVRTALETPAVLNLRLNVLESNTLGMPGRMLISGPSGQPELLDPGPDGDLAARNILDEQSGAKKVRWFLFDLRGTLGDRLWQWQRLVDRESTPASAWFRVFSRYPGGGVKDEQEYRLGTLFRSTSYDNRGNPLREYRYALVDGLAVVSEFSEYRRENGRLAEQVIREGDGRLRQSIGFDYTLDGRVRQTTRHFPDGHEERFLFRYGSSGLDESWMDDSQEGLRWIYDSQGRLVRMEEWHEGVAIKVVATNWAAAQGSLIASRETTDPVNKIVFLEVFDEQGRLVQNDETRAGELWSRTSQVWNPDGTLGEISVTGQGKSETTTWEYQDKTKTLERYSKDGVPVRVTTYQGVDHMDELYLDGKPILRVYYRDNIRFKEEELRNGHVIRTRTIK